MSFPSAHWCDGPFRVLFTVAFGLFLFSVTGCQTFPPGERSPVSETGVGPEEEPEDAPDEPRDDEEEVGPRVTEAPAVVRLGDRTVFGWVEWICLLPECLQIKAKMDSGARTSSMNAQNMVEFERDGRRWVRFSIEHPETGEPLKLERPVVRFLRIVQHEGDFQRRPVVELEVRLGGIHQKTEFSLVDRSSFIYQVLIGRNFLRGWGLIDSEETFLSGHPCQCD